VSDRNEFIEACGRYWMLAYNEGREGREHDTENGDAAKTWGSILDHYDRLRRELAEERESHEQLQARCFDGNGSQSVFDAVVQARRELAEARKVLRKTYGCIGTLRRMADSPAREQYEELQREIDAAMAKTKEVPK
jgi:hypothetical protein